MPQATLENRPYINSNLFSTHYLDERLQDYEEWNCDEEAGGFAGFRETATKTNSLVDRLKELTLPDPAKVETGLRSYREIRERADELDEKIQKTDSLIDKIVYELYGLSEDEIEIVEEAVD